MTCTLDRLPVPRDRQHAHRASGSSFRDREHDHAPAPRPRLGVGHTGCRDQALCNEVAACQRLAESFPMMCWGHVTKQNTSVREGVWRARWRYRVGVYATWASGSGQPVVRLECRIALIDTLASWLRAQTDRLSIQAKARARSEPPGAGLRADPPQRLPDRRTLKRSATEGGGTSRAAAEFQQR